MLRFMRSKLWLIFTLTLTSIMWGQSTTVSVTVVDPTSQVWANGTISYIFQGNGTFYGQYQWDGANLPANYLVNTTVNLNSSGAASFSIPTSTAIAPANSSWNFIVCPNASFKCITVTIPTTGSTQNISSTVNAAIPALSVPAALIPRAYTDSEIQLTINQGAIYYNTTSALLRFWNGSAWANLAGGGGGGSPGGANFSIQYNSSGTFAGASLNGIVVASSSGAPSVATFSTIVNLWASGSCTTGYLKFDGTCSTPSGIPYPGVGIPCSTGSAWCTSFTIAGSGTIVPTEIGPFVLNNLVSYVTTTGQIQDAGVNEANLALLNSGQTFTGTKNTFTNIVQAGTLTDGTCSISGGTLTGCSSPAITITLTGAVTGSGTTSIATLIAGLGTAGNIPQSNGSGAFNASPTFPLFMDTDGFLNGVSGANWVSTTAPPVGVYDGEFISNTTSTATTQVGIEFSTGTFSIPTSYFIGRYSSSFTAAPSVGAIPGENVINTLQSNLGILRDGTGVKIHFGEYSSGIVKDDLVVTGGVNSNVFLSQFTGGGGGLLGFVNSGEIAGAFTVTPLSYNATTGALSITTFTSSTSGIVSASGGGTTNFLRADGTWTTPAGGGTVTSIATTGPIGGGTITTTGTITCTTCVVASSPGLGIAHFAGSTQTVTSSLVDLSSDVSGKLPNTNLATQTANTVLGALTATTPSGLTMPSCSGASDALIWTSGTGFGCNTISGGAVSNVSNSDGTETISPTTGAVVSSVNLAHAFIWTAVHTFSPPFGSGGTILNQATGATTSCANAFLSVQRAASFVGCGYINSGTGVVHWSNSAGWAFDQFLTVTGTFAASTSITGASYLTASNCASSASPAVCGSAAAGAFTIAATTTSIVVNTTAVTANSEIEITPDASLSTRLGITCNSTLASIIGPVVTARTVATSFTVTITGTLVTNPACYTYTITN